MLHHHLADVPQEERKRPSFLGIALLSGVPHITITINTSSTVAIDVNTFARENEPGPVVLELDGIRVLAPIRQVVREAPRAAPLDDNILDGGVQARGDVVGRAGGEHDCAAAVAVSKCLENLRDVVVAGAEGRDGACLAAVCGSFWSWVGERSE